MTAASRKPVPAVQSVLAIFEYLRSVDNEPQRLSDIGRGTDMNLSTCFNVLKTLEAGGLISFDESSKTYRLGLRLAELGAIVDGRRLSQQRAMEEVRRVANVTGLGCFLITFDEHEEFVVLGKVESKNSIRTTIDVGATFPAIGSLASKAWFAWKPDSVVDDLLRRHELHAYTERSITTVEGFKQELAAVRDRGFATSVGEYYPDHNAVAAPVFGWDGEPQFLLVVVGTTSQLRAGAQLRHIGEEVARAASSVTKEIGGQQQSDRA